GVLVIFFLVALSLFGARILPNYPRQLQIATVVSVPLFVYSSLWNFLMIGLGQIIVMNLIQVSVAAVSLVCTTILIVGASLGLTAAVSIYAGALALQVILMVLFESRLSRASQVQRREGLFCAM